MQECRYIDDEIDMVMNKLPFKSLEPKRRLVYIILLIVWSLRLVSGLYDIANRHVPAYPDAIRGSPDIGQFEFDVAIPVAFMIFNLLMLLFANKFPRWLDLIFAALQIIGLLMLLFLAGGGV